MDTLARRSQPHILHCAHYGCGQPIDLWHWGVVWWTDLDGSLPLFCLDHALALAPPQERDGLRVSVTRMAHDVRQRVGLPGGTLISCAEDIGNQNPRSSTRFPGTIFGVVVDAWDGSWPPYRTTWRGPGADGRAQFVILAGYSTAGPDINAGWLTCWSWQHPDAEPIPAPYPPDFVPTTAEWRRYFDARGAFFALPPRGGRAGTGRFEMAEDAEEALRRAMRGLLAKGQPVTRTAVGAYLVKEGTSRAAIVGDTPKDPGRQVRRICTKHGINFDAVRSEELKRQTPVNN